MAKKKKKATKKAETTEESEPTKVDPAVSVEAPAPPAVAMVAHRPKAVKLVHVGTAHSLTDLPADCQREPTSFKDAVSLVMARYAATGRTANKKQAKRAAALAWPELHEAANSPRV